MLEASPQWQLALGMSVSFGLSSWAGKFSNDPDLLPGE